MNRKINIVSDECARFPQNILRNIINDSIRIPSTFRLQFQPNATDQTKNRTSLFHNKTDMKALEQWEKIQQIRRNPRLFEESLRAENRKKNECPTKKSKLPRSKYTQNLKSKNPFGKVNKSLSKSEHKCHLKSNKIQNQAFSSLE